MESAPERGDLVWLQFDPQTEQVATVPPEVVREVLAKVRVLVL